MDLNFTPEEEIFRSAVRQFLADKLSPQLASTVAQGRHLGKAEMEQWHAVLNERGWLANHWPREFGGPGWSVIEKYIFETECALAHAPRVLPFGVNMLGPGRAGGAGAIGARCRQRPPHQFEQIERQRLVQRVGVLRVERQRLELLGFHQIGRDIDARRCVLADVDDQRAFDAGDQYEIGIARAQ